MWEQETQPFRRVYVLTLRADGYLLRVVAGAAADGRQLAGLRPPAACECRV